MRRFCLVAVFVAVLVAFYALAAQAGGKGWAIVVNSGDVETAWNAMRVARFAMKSGEDVSVFFLGKGVEAAHVAGEPFDVKGLMEELAKDGGKVYACKACLRLHKRQPTEDCPAGTLKILYDIIERADKVLIF